MGTPFSTQDTPERVIMPTGGCQGQLKGVLNVGIKEVNVVKEASIKKMEDVDINEDTLDEGDLLIYNKVLTKWQNKQFTDYFSYKINLDGGDFLSPEELAELGQ